MKVKMYLRCKNCGWTQDDFWDESYNPLKSLLDWEEVLLEKDLDEDEIGGNSVRDVIVEDVLKCARRIDRMRYKTVEDFRNKNPHKICPDCGENSIVLD